MAGVGSTSLSLGRRAPILSTRIWTALGFVALAGCFFLAGVHLESWMAVLSCLAFVQARRPLRAVGIPVAASLDTLLLAPITVMSGPWIPIVIIVAAQCLRRSASEDVRKANILIGVASAAFATVGAQLVLLLWSPHESRWILATITAFSVGGVINILALQSFDRSWRKRVLSLSYDPWTSQTALASVVGLLVTSVATHLFATGYPVAGIGAMLGLLPIRPYLKAALRRNRSRNHAARLMSGMLEWSHPYTEGHVKRVANWATEVGYELGLPPHHVDDLKFAAILHDVGKVTVNEAVLDAPRKLTDEEFEHIKIHSANGATLLADLPGFERIQEWILAHHERLDGNGYPLGLSDDAIPLESKVIAVIDAFDAMTGGDKDDEKRNYRTPKSPEEAFAELDRCSGTQFDPTVVQAFRAVWRRS